jgi:hypothetical protein
VRVCARASISDVNYSRHSSVLLGMVSSYAF